MFGVCSDSSSLSSASSLLSSVSSSHRESLGASDWWMVPERLSISSEAQQLLPLSVVTGDEGVEELKEGRGDWHRSHGTKDLNDRA